MHKISTFNILQHNSWHKIFIFFIPSTQMKFQIHNLKKKKKIEWI